MKDSNNLDDLIGGQQPIIVKEDGDKKLIYILLVVLIILFIVALGMIAFLGSKYFSSNSATNAGANSVAITKPVATQNNQVVSNNASVPTKQNSVSKIEQALQQQQPVQVSNQIQASNQNMQPEVKKPTTQPQQQAQTNATSVAQAVTKVANASGNKQLSPEEIAKIVQIVMQQQAKLKQQEKAMPKVAPQQVTQNSDDIALAQALESSAPDTLKEENIDVSKINQAINVSAKGSNKKVDTFNKVVVNENSGNDNDELSKLASEIDSIIESQDAQKDTSEFANKQEYNKEIDTREKEMRYIVVKPGDTLSSIAHKAYGRASAYMKIFKANPDLVKNPNKIYVGMRLRVPMDEEYKAHNK